MADDGGSAIWMRSRLDTLDIQSERAAGLKFRQHGLERDDMRESRKSVVVCCAEAGLL
jgi:hypothetical protein